jgi:hypothetical protein
MATIKFTYALQRFFPGLKDTPAKGNTLAELLHAANERFPGIRSYLLDEQGRLRQHVNIFIDGTLIKDRNDLSDPFSDNSEIYIMQALSGG